MPVPGTIKLTGFTELDRELSRLPTKLQQKVMRKAVREGSKVVQKDARRRVPVRTTGWPGIDYGHEPGALKKLIKVRRTKKTPKWIIRDEVGFKYKRAPAYYGLWVEYGHDLVRNKKVIGHVQAQPFLRPAFDNNKNAVINKMKAVIKAGIANYKKG